MAKKKFPTSICRPMKQLICMWKVGDCSGERVESKALFDLHHNAPRRVPFLCYIVFSYIPFWFCHCTRPCSTTIHHARRQRVHNRGRLKQQPVFFSFEPQHLDLEYFCKYLGSLSLPTVLLLLSYRRRALSCTTMDGFLAFIYWTAGWLV